MTKSTSNPGTSAVHDVIVLHRDSIRQTWTTDIHRIPDLTRLDRQVIDDCCERLVDRLIALLATPLAQSKGNIGEPMRDLLSSMSVNFAERGLTPSQTASFIFSLKPVLLTVLPADVEGLVTVNEIVDKMGLFSLEMFMQRREQIIHNQAQELLDLSVPVVPLWEGILLMPIIGTLDSNRAQAITEKLLLEIERTGSRHAVLDISGVPTVDTQTAQHLARTVAAARLMGAECVITGIRPAIAQTMVSLGIDLSSVATRFSLAEGLRMSFARLGLHVEKRAA